MIRFKPSSPCRPRQGSTRLPIRGWWHGAVTRAAMKTTTEGCSSTTCRLCRISNNRHWWGSSSSIARLLLRGVPFSPVSHLPFVLGVMKFKWLHREHSTQFTTLPSSAPGSPLMASLCSAFQPLASTARRQTTPSFRIAHLLLPLPTPTTTDPNQRLHFPVSTWLNYTNPVSHTKHWTLWILVLGFVDCTNWTGCHQFGDRKKKREDSIWFGLETNKHSLLFWFFYLVFNSGSSGYFYIWFDATLLFIRVGFCCWLNFGFYMFSDYYYWIYVTHEPDFCLFYCLWSIIHYIFSGSFQVAGWTRLFHFWQYLVKESKFGQCFASASPIGNHKQIFQHKSSVVCLFVLEPLD